ncbi:U32 family peptidase [bacterium]|nr:U32 family peptidase [bacterium]MBR2651997.1 U32 family peptidase [bacterium]
MVTNFADYLENHNDEYVRNKAIFIREEKRKYKNVIFEDLHGTHMFSGYELCLIKHIKTLYDSGLDYIKIDNILQTNDEYNLRYYKIYRTILDAIANNNLNNELITNLISLTKTISDNEIAEGFIGGIREIKHYENI